MGFESFSKESSWSEISIRTDFSEKSRSNIGGHGPARPARRVLVAPSGCRCAPARSATCPACTLPGRSCSHQGWRHICDKSELANGLCAAGIGASMGIPFSLYQRIGRSGSFRPGPAVLGSCRASQTWEKVNSITPAAAPLHLLFDVRPDRALDGRTERVDFVRFHERPTCWPTASNAPNPKDHRVSPDSDWPPSGQGRRHSAKITNLVNLRAVLA